MKTQQFPERLINSIQESHDFRQALMRLKEGKPATPRSWVYEKRDANEVLREWLGILMSNEVRDLDEISEWDKARSAKFGYQGEVAPFSERQDTLKEYWAHLDTPSVFSTRNWERAKANVRAKLGFNHSGSPAPVDAIIKRGISEDKYNTSSGDPLFKKRKSPEAIAQAKAAAENGSWKQFYPVLGSRASMGKVGKDARWIFMFPMSVNLYEQRFQQPLQDYVRLKGVPFFTPWEGFDHVQNVLSSIPQEDLKFGCDYTKMDQHFNHSHAMQVFDVIKHYFQPKYWGELNESIDYTFTCSVVAPEYLILGPHAMPSGSGWTNFLETMFNYILVEYVRITYGLKIDEIRTMGIGDDQLWIIKWNGEWKRLVDLIVATFKKCGLDANLEKQEVSYDEISFLQRRSWNFWAPDGERYAAVYPTVRALTSEIFPEFYHNSKFWTKNTFALRCLMILENCVNHPKFKEFCIFVAKGNENIVEFALSDDAVILETRRQAKKIANFLPTYNQEKVNASPLEFKSLAVIREHFRKAS